MGDTNAKELADELSVDARVLMRVLDELGEPVAGLDVPLSLSAISQVRAIVASQKATTGQPFDPPSPSGRELGWHAGAVRRPDHPDLLAKIRDVSSRYPALRAHRRALERLGSQIVYANWCGDKGLTGSAVVLVRFSGAIESAFGFTREAMILYTPHDDLQVRSFQSARREMADLKRPITPDISFFLGARSTSQDETRRLVAAIELGDPLGPNRRRRANRINHAAARLHLHSAT